MMTSCALALALAGCAVGPDYTRPTAPVPAAYKEATTAAGATWLPAAPPEAFARGEWWLLFGDAELNRLVARIDVDNQNVAAQAAAYRQAQAVVREARAARWPTLGLTGSARRTGGRSQAEVNAFQASFAADWAPDLWGKLGRGVDSAQASAEASAADLASAKLSAQGELAIDYFSLREADTEVTLLVRTIEGYERALQITTNRYDAGIAPKTDVLQAQTQLASTRADLAALRADRAKFEHAIAVLVGVAPGDFAVAEMPWTPVVPAVPLGIPSELLQRRPDIASAERQVVVANAQIGIERSAYYPSLTLSGTAGNSVSRLGDLLSASGAIWSLGVSVAQTIFDAGATRARVEGAEAGLDAAIARYRQTVLTAFQAVEDQLSSARSLAEQEDLRRQASNAADQVEQQVLNRYRAGQVGYTDVVTAQASALSARRALTQARVNRQVSAITLIQNLGGGWERIETP